MAVSEITATSAAKASRYRSTAASKFGEPISSSPSTTTFRLIGKRSARAQVRVDRREMHEHLSLVVHRTAAENLSVAHRSLERRTVPQLDRIDRLHVVVAVHEQRRLSRRLHPLAVCQRIAGGFEHARAQADLVHAVDQMLAAAPDVAVVIRIGADRRDRNQPFKFFEIARLVPRARLDQLRVDRRHYDCPSTNGSPNCTSNVLPERSTSNSCGFPSYARCWV